MVKFAFVGTVELQMENEEGKPVSELKEVKFGLEMLGGLNKRAYLRPDDLPTEQGLKMLTLAFVQGLVSLTHYGRKEGYLKYRPHIEYIVKEILRSAEHVEKLDDMQVTSDTFTPRKKRSTHIDLVADLQERNTQGQYDELIKRAVLFWYHDFKQPDDAPGGPKMLLADDLSKFPELGDLRDRTINGYYDETMDDEDQKRVFGDFLKHSTKKNT